MLFAGQPRAYHRWDGNRFILAPMPSDTGGMIPSMPELSQAIAQQAANSNVGGQRASAGGGDSGGTSGVGNTFGGGFAGPGDLDQVASAMTPGREDMASMLGSTIGGAALGPLGAAVAGAGGGMLAGMQPGKAVGGSLGGLLGGAALGPLGAIGGGLLGSALGRGFDPPTAEEIADMARMSWDPTYAIQQIEAPNLSALGLGGIGGTATGPWGSIGDVGFGYGALGTPSSFGFDANGNVVGNWSGNESTTGPSAADKDAVGAGMASAAEQAAIDAAVADAAAGAGAGTGSSKVVCTAMCEAYGFGSFRQKIWLEHAINLRPEYQAGYHALFLPLVRLAYKRDVKWLRAVLEHTARHRTADIWKQKRGRRDWIGAVERAALEPLCFAVGYVSLRVGRSARS
jgi:hypothetical protein